jgi:hypothetical protein
MKGGAEVGESFDIVGYLLEVVKRLWYNHTSYSKQSSTSF